MAKRTANLIDRKMELWDDFFNKSEMTEQEFRHMFLVFFCSFMERQNESLDLIKEEIKEIDKSVHSLGSRIEDLKKIIEKRNGI